MGQPMTFLQAFTLLGYVGALAFAFLYGGFRLRPIAAWCLGFLGSGFCAHASHLGLRWLELGYIPATNLSELCDAMAFVLVLLFLALYPFLRNIVLTFFLTPLAALFYILSLMLPSSATEPKPFFFTPWFVVHILLLLLGMGFFFLSFLYATVFIMQDHRLRRQHSPPRLALPSLEEAQRKATAFLLVGYPPFTLGIFSSVLYGIRFGSGKDWHPGLMEGASVAAWLVLGLAICGWSTARVRPRKRSWLIVAGASFSALIILGILWH